MEIRISTEDAYQFATRHESDSTGKDREMDLKNNSIGRGIGRSKTGQHWLARKFATLAGPPRGTESYGSSRAATSSGAIGEI
ncbi:DUF6973 domain-containing protein [Streptomyces atratus]|uniref:DUF6973 domain-containing protein n=1 Tax=Streptomyces atratus TaxID=1893 RepID=UPI003F53EDD2